MLTAGAAAANSTTDTLDLDEIRRLKDANVQGVHDPQLHAVGETIGNAVPIPAIPFGDTGNTCEFLDDYDEVCPLGGSTSPDVVYSYSPSASIEVDIDLCDSGYDTKAYVYENSADNLVACNDDFCGSDGFRSLLAYVPMTAGNTYYIVVDGYSGDCGTYALHIVESGPCAFLCGPGDIHEGEPECHDGYIDEFNGGCNSVPHAFSTVRCDFVDGQVTVCGRYGGFLEPGTDEQRRDTDWFTVSEDSLDGYTFCVTGEYATLVGYVDADVGCGAPVFEESDVVVPCEQRCFQVPPGNWWLFVATSGFGEAAGACGGDYLMEFSGVRCSIDPIEPSSWGTIKGRYAESSHGGGSP